uniref:Photosystem I assembly protein Ycf4 n=1 Tax=Ahnfeltia plicata TaxID=28023 RepID=A0A1C9CAX7_9FLOR|nr:photosystem I assembly protein Ycf4 [Ahnfeltia plicata]AOM65543.1 photosystem I assembly protein Ycf4 [Ahnfeltia plicata]UAT97196.1 photosystem I assembly protein Ycf4 [Ahnfeltia plicata]UAT97401.1 photosystem I assembly protein Ycf4 [Ahnfeltia plicata]
MALNTQKVSKIRTDEILGSRRFSNYWWATTILLGGLGFFLVGLSSYLKIELLPFTKSSELLFIPQGIIMTFYGTIAILLSIFLWLTIFWNVGGGYNEFNNNEGIITIFRLGFPGKNRILQLEYNIQDIQSIRVSIQDGLTPRREIYLKMKDKREIPLTRVGQPLLLSEIEEQATTLAKFLGVVLEGIN